MILELDKLSNDTEQVAADEVVTFEDVDGKENRIHCHIELNIRRVAETYLIHADLDGRFATPCHRCLEPAECHIKSSFDLVVKKASTDAKVPPVDEDARDDAMVSLPAGATELSLDHLIFENLVSEIPMQIRCRDECKGLCSSCGVNLNTAECDCQPHTDPRWNALRSLGRRDDTPSK
ncbi:MAG: DUF177 domain-containing protein [Candidatus Latescibacterota bacterium]|nr:MAG: DUF177 domain-containing protein [Candidatus Latescibacterota bacterium]